MLHQKFKIASLEDLRKFAEGGELKMVDGFGAKTAERINAVLRDIGDTYHCSSVP